MTLPSGAHRAVVWAVLCLVMAVAAVLKHRQNEVRRAEILAAQTVQPSRSAYDGWARFFHSLAGQRPEVVRQSIEARAPVSVEGFWPAAAGYWELGFNDHAAGWRFVLRFKDERLQPGSAGQTIPPAFARPSRSFARVEALRRTVFNGALWFSMAAMAAAVLLPLLRKQSPSSGTRALRRVLGEVGLALAAVGMTAYWVAPDVLAQFGGRGFITDETLQSYAWLLVAGPVLLWALRERRERRSGPTCDDCGYNLTGNVSGACPECGTATSSRTRARSGTTR